MFFSHLREISELNIAMYTLPFTVELDGVQLGQMLAVPVPTIKLLPEPQAMQLNPSSEVIYRVGRTKNWTCKQRLNLDRQEDI